ncbi:MAG: BREX system Lon protease-like protein BrxL [Cyanobacteriota bacterium]
MNSSNNKLNEIFGSMIIDKKRLPSSGLVQMGIPSYVGEWVIQKLVPGEGMLNSDEFQKINKFVKKAFPRKDDKEIIKNDLIVNKMPVSLLVKINAYVDISKEVNLARIKAAGLDKCYIISELVDRNPDLLRHGLWGKVKLIPAEHLEFKDVPVEIVEFEPMQTSTVNLDLFISKRKEFTFEEWRQLMVNSAGYNPSSYNFDQQTWLLARLIPIVEKNYHIFELAPKGTGKSYIYENISPRIQFVSGGKVSPAVLFMNNRSGEVGIIGKYDVVVLDEVQSLTFDNPDEIIGVLKGYLANNRYNRGGKTDISSDCSLVMLANIELNELMKPKNDFLIADLPEFLHETAFLDRIAGIIPGWEIPKFELTMAANDLGFKADFFGEILTSFRYDSRFWDFVSRKISFKDSGVTIRDRNNILKSASGFLKLLFPDLIVSDDEFYHYCVKPALTLRQNIRDQLWFKDDEFRNLPKDLKVTINSQNISV